MEDLRSAIELVPEAKRSRNLIIGAHSMGVVWALCYMGWDFDGSEATVEDAGFKSVAGAVLLDAPIAAYPPLLTREEYLSIINGIRDGSRTDTRDSSRCCPLRH